MPVRQAKQASKQSFPEGRQRKIDNVVRRKRHIQLHGTLHLYAYRYKLSMIVCQLDERTHENHCTERNQSN